MRLKIRAIFVILSACVAMSCATSRDITELRRSINEQNALAESRLISLDERIVVLDSLVREQLNISMSLRAVIGTQSEEQRENIGMITARQDEINYQLRQLLEKLQIIQLYGGSQPSSPDQQKSLQQQPQSQSSTAQPAPVPQQPKVDPQALYDAALDDVRNERYALGESRFLSFLMQFPRHELAGNAQYWLGEAVYGEGKYELAIKEFEKVVEKYNKSPKIPASLLKIGFAQFELGDVENATKTLNNLIKSYPKLDEADLARARLTNPDQSTPQ